MHFYFPQKKSLRMIYNHFEKWGYGARADPPYTQNTQAA